MNLSFAIPFSHVPHEEGVYLLHFETPITGWHTTQHYIGYSEYLDRRIYEEMLGGSRAARLCQIACEREIPIHIARVWVNGTQDLEKQLKKWKCGPRLCPICVGESRPIQLVLPGFRQQARRKGW